MTDRPRFKASISGRKFRLKTSYTVRNEEAETNRTPGVKSKKERRRIRRKFEKMDQEE